MPTTLRGYPYPDPDDGPPDGPYELQRLAEAVDADVSASLGDTGWLAAVMLNTWANYGAPYVTCRYRRRAGVVYLQGMVKGGTINQPVLNLPAGFRTAAQLFIPTSVNNGTTIASVFDVKPTGDVLLPVGGVTWAALNVSFPL